MVDTRGCGVQARRWRCGAARQPTRAARLRALIDTERLFLGTVLDRHRPRIALPPFPKAAPPPSAPTEQRKQVSSRILQVCGSLPMPNTVMGLWVSAAVWASNP